MRAHDWGINLKGHQSDLEDWCDILHSPFDPYVEVLQKDGQVMFVLYSQDLQGCIDPSHVRDLAVPLLRQLNALASIERKSHPLEEDGIVERDVDGNILGRHCLVVGTVRVRSRARGTATAIDARTGEAIHQPPRPSFTQLALINAPEELKEALEHFGRADNWHDLYKAFEAIENVCGERGNIVRRCNVTRGEVTTCARNLNFHRHHRPELLPIVWDFKTSKKFVAGLLRTLLTQ